MSSDNDTCFSMSRNQPYGMLLPHIRCFDCNKYGHIAMDCPDNHQAHQHATEVTPPIGMIGPPLGIIVTPDIFIVITKIGPGLVVSNLAHIIMDIGVAAIMTPIGATPCHSTDLPDIVFLCHRSSSSHRYCRDTPHHRSSSHRKFFLR